MQFYRGLQIPTSTPTEDGGLSVVNNDKYERDGWYPLTEDTHWDDQAASTSTITMAADLTAWLFPGTPVKFKLSGSYYYGILTTVAAGLLTIAGAPLTTGDGDLEELWIGDPSKLRLIERHIASTFSDGANAALLLTDSKEPLRWDGPKAYLVQFGIYADVATNTPNVTVMIEAAAVSTENANAGPTLSVAQTWYTSGIAINTTNYEINYGEDVEIATTIAATASDLTVRMAFVEA